MGVRVHDAASPGGSDTSSMGVRVHDAASPGGSDQQQQLPDRINFHSVADEMPLSSTLYLSTMRVMLGVFLLCGFISIPSIYLFSKSDESYNIYYAVAERTGLGGFTPTSWSPGGTSFCSGHGFAAVVCTPGGWGSDAADYECGRVPTNVSVPSTTALSYGNPFSLRNEISCVSSRVICSCFPGFSGERCNITATIVPTVASLGWCVPSMDAFSSLGKESNYIPITRGADVCSARGSCILRRASISTKDESFSFCACDEGWWGETCGNADNSTTMKFGLNNLKLVDQSHAEECGIGAAPIAEHNLGFVYLSPGRCSQHGFIGRLDLTAEGRMLEGSNFYRPQTAGVCFCEGGYTGEECLGGQPPPLFTSIITLFTTIILLIGTLFSYRRRHAITDAYDRNHVSPADYTAYVDGLPALDLDATAEVAAHFAHWGPIHDVVPAFKDEALRFWVICKNDALERLRVLEEFEAHAEATAQLHVDTQGVPRFAPWIASLLAQVGLLSAAPPVRLPRFDDRYLETDVRAEMHPLALIACYTPGVCDLIFLFRVPLVAYIAALNAKIFAARRSSRVFSRAFVTFQYSRDVHSAVHAHAARSSGICDCEPLPPVNLLFRGMHDLRLRVKRAEEPGEVLWDSLDTGDRSRTLRLWVNGTFVVFVCCAIFFLVAQLPTNSGDPIAILGKSLFVVIVNLCLTRVWWLTSTYVEQPVSEGERMRSLFYSILASQLSVLIAANVGLYGAPMDSKNGYIKDFYSSSGSFMLEVTLLDAILSPCLSFFVPYWRGMKWFYEKGGSASYRKIVARPPSNTLAGRSAMLMRIVFICCAFSPGLPLLNFATAFCIFTQVLADSHAFTHVYALESSGAELPRTLESCLLGGVLLNAFLSWMTKVTPGGGSGENLALITLLVFIGFVAWVESGYFSWKTYHGKDCFGGGLGILCCFNKRFVKLHEYVHVTFMQLVFGNRFFNYYVANPSLRPRDLHLPPPLSSKHLIESSTTSGKKGAKVAMKAVAARAATSWKLFYGMLMGVPLGTDGMDETEGRSYHDVSQSTPIWELKKHPYAVFERAQIQTWLTIRDVPAPSQPMTAHQRFIKRDLHESSRMLIETRRRNEEPVVAEEAAEPVIVSSTIDVGAEKNDYL